MSNNTQKNIEAYWENMVNTATRQELSDLYAEVFVVQNWLKKPQTPDERKRMQQINKLKKSWKLPNITITKEAKIISEEKSEDKKQTQQIYEVPGSFIVPDEDIRMLPREITPKETREYRGYKLKVEPTIEIMREVDRRIEDNSIV